MTASGPEELPPSSEATATPTGNDRGAQAKGPENSPGAETARPNPVSNRVALQLYRGAGKAVHHNPLLRMAMAIPRTLRFLADNLERQLSGAEVEEGGIPVPHVSPSLAAHVALDEAILGLAMGPNRFPRRADYQRVGAELEATRKLYRERGWLDDPASYHRTPPPLEQPEIRKGQALTAEWPFRLEYESLHFESGFEPYPEEPGRERWLGYEPNHEAAAWVLRHDDDAERPWLVCLHGFAMGYPVMDFAAFAARRLHEELGLNLVFPVLPLHGHRKITRMSGDAFLSFDLVNTVHGRSQAVWDVRRVLSWVRSQGARRVGLYGVSLGAYVTALTATTDEELDCVIAGVPVCDFPSLFRQLSPGHIRIRAIDHNILGGAAEEVHRVVSPLAMPPRVPRERRFIFAGLGDRVASPAQTERLWEHWERPEVAWYQGGHVGYLWHSKVREFVTRALKSSGLEFLRNRGPRE